MRPDRSNYETWIVDYLDGILGKDQVKELFSFLRDNPDLMEEFNDLQMHPVNTKVFKFHHKESLKKSIHQLSGGQFEKLCVANLENDLSPEQQIELDEIISSDPERRSTFILIQRTKLVPRTLVYPYKKSLYRLSVLQKGSRIAAVITGIAATLLILVTLLTNRPTLTPQAESIAVADTLSEPALIITGTDAPEIHERVNAGVPGKTKESEIKPVLAENNISTAGHDDSLIARMPEVKKAEFRQEIALAALPEPAGLTISTGTNTIVTDYYASEAEDETRSVGRLIRDRLKRNEPSEKEKITAFDVADAGINGLNKLFGWDISLDKNTANDGSVKSVNFNSKLIKVSAPVKKSEPEE